jgi:hypothetical protein
MSQPQLEPSLRKQQDAGNLKNNACPVCKGVEEHGQACIATRLFKTLARVGCGVRRKTFQQSTRRF